MINPVSSVSFRSSAVGATAVQDPFARPGKFTMPESAPVTPKKKGKFWKGLAIGVGAALAVSAALIAGVKTGKLNKVADLSNAKLMQKAGHYLAVAGEWLDSKAWQPIAQFVSSKFAKASAPNNP